MKTQLFADQDTNARLVANVVFVIQHLENNIKHNTIQYMSFKKPRSVLTPDNPWLNNDRERKGKEKSLPDRETEVATFQSPTFKDPMNYSLWSFLGEKACGFGKE